MKTRQVYQTLEDRDNPDEVEVSGPFLCTRNDAWLGQGYYFWESFIDNAHWWGANTYSDGYIICQASYIDDEDNCFDLTKEEGINELKGAMSLMQQAGINMSNQTYVSRVIEYLKNAGQFKWEATKVNVTNTKTQGSKYDYRARLHPKYPHAYIDLCPPIQICFFVTSYLG